MSVTSPTLKVPELVDVLPELVLLELADEPPLLAELVLLLLLLPHAASPPASTAVANATTP
jgi:hypothetical protein